jgi:hypothetical protein
LRYQGTEERQQFRKSQITFAAQISKNAQAERMVKPTALLICERLPDDGNVSGAATLASLTSNQLNRSSFVKY